MSQPVWSYTADFTLLCGGRQHRLRFSDGLLTALDHCDRQMDALGVFTVLGGQTDQKVPRFDLIRAFDGDVLEDLPDEQPSCRARASTVSNTYQTNPGEWRRMGWRQKRRGRPVTCLTSTFARSR